MYRQNVPYPNLKGKDVILVDDGIATGSTMKAALASVKNRGAKTVTVAVPVGPPSTIEELKSKQTASYASTRPSTSPPSGNSTGILAKPATKK